MKIKCITFLIILSALTELSSQPYYPLSWDPDLSPRTGADNLQFIHQGFFIWEERFLKNKWWEESNIMKRFAGMLYRSAKGALVVDFATYYSVILQHEVFGHGFRAREVNPKEIEYEINLPAPWGTSRGVTNITWGDTPDINQQLALFMGGTEATGIMSHQLRLKWLAGQKIPFYQASQYITSNLDLFNYIRTEKDLSQASSGHDIKNYVRVMNTNYMTNPGSDSLTQDILETNSAVIVVDPFLFYSIWAYFKTFIWSGEIDFKYPMIPLGPVRYLPAFGFALTPFGGENSFHNYFFLKNRSLALFYRYGDDHFNSFWGTGFETRGMLPLPYGTLDLRGEIWDQPEMPSGVFRILPNEPGAALWVKTHIPLPMVYKNFAAHLEAGYKMKGYVQGEAFASGVNFRLGAVLFQ